jgi:hypothetical protein
VLGPLGGATPRGRAWVGKRYCGYQLCVTDGDVDGPERKHAPPGELDWAHIEQLKRIANRYLDEHHYEIPKIRQLPSAHYEVNRHPTWFAKSDQPACGQRGRIESYMWGSTGTDVLSCARPKGHGGRHTAEPVIPTFFRLGWKVASWANPVDGGGTSNPTDQDPVTGFEPVPAPLSNRDRWRNGVSLVGILLGFASAMAAGPLLINGLIWQAAICFVIALLLLAPSFITRTGLLRRYSGR